MLLHQYHPAALALTPQMNLRGFLTMVLSGTTVYRIHVNKDSTVATQVIKGPFGPSGHARLYDSTDHLPQWMQEKLAVLSIMTANPPTSEVDGVGRRISDDIFWVYK